MVTLVRSLLIIIFRVMLFVGLFVLSMRFIHTYPLPMPPDQQHQLFVLSRKLGIRDPDDLYLSVVAIVNLIAAAIEYTLLMRLWRMVKMKWRGYAVKSR
jgi:hypothetical protein